MLPPSDFELMLQTVDMAMVRTTPGGKTLSPEMIRLLGLAMFGGYLLFPSKRERECLTPYVNFEGVDLQAK